MPLDNMAAPRPIVVAHTGGPRTWDVVAEALHGVGAELKLASWSNEEELIAAAGDAVALVQGGPVRFSGTIMDRLPRLRFIAAQGIGVDFTDIPDATERGIVIVNLVGVIHREVAAHTMALLLGLVRHIVPFNEGMKTGTRGQRPRTVHHLYGETLGIVSYGNIGRTVAREAKAFDLRVIAYDPFVPPASMRDDGVEPVDLEQLFREADFVSVHTPLSPETFHMIGEKHFRLMKPDAYFLNNGRGKVVDEAALIKALQEGWIAAAGLDVLEQEPPDRANPLLTMDNVILTPHAASLSTLASVERRKRLAEELTRCVTGCWPRYGLVNKGVQPKVPLKSD